MTGDRLPDGDHVVRYVRPRQVRDGRADGSAFRLRPGEDALSVNWLEAFPPDTEEQIVAVREVIRMRISRSGRFAELQVGEVTHRLAQTVEVSFRHRPLDADGPWPVDPSHVEVSGLPSSDADRMVLVGDMIAKCVRRLHPAVLERCATTGA